MVQGSRVTKERYSHKYIENVDEKLTVYKKRMQKKGKNNLNLPKHQRKRHCEKLLYIFIYKMKYVDKKN